MRTFKYFFTLFIFALHLSISEAWESMPSIEQEAIQKILTKRTAEQLGVDIKNLRLAPQFMKQSNGWIFISLDIKNAAEQPFEYEAGHDLYEAAQEGIVRNSVEALLRKKGGHWELVDIALNANDVAWDGWDEKYHAPKHIFYTTCLRPGVAACKRLNQIAAPWRGTWHLPIYYYGRSVDPPELLPLTIEEQKIVWKPCGHGARKVKIFSKFAGQTNGIVLAIEGEPCINEEGHFFSYIHLKKEEEHHNNWSCAAQISFYESPSDAAYTENPHLYRNIYTKSSCSTFAPAERINMLKIVEEAAAKHLNIKKAELRLGSHRIEAIGDWIFITAGALIDSEDKIIITVAESDITHFISALLKRNGNTWSLVEIDAGTEANKALYQKWRKTHHIPQDDKQKRICPEACPE